MISREPDDKMTYRMYIMMISLILLMKGRSGTKKRPSHTIPGIRAPSYLCTGESEHGKCTNNELLLQYRSP